MNDSKQKILLVDDSSENIHILGGLLSNYKRVIALNGEKALSILETGSLPDLILLDVEMPGINGFEVCKKIRLSDKYKNIPIIFLTGLTDKESMMTGFKVGGQDYVTKPFDKNELLARVRTHLELKQHKDKLEDIVALRTEQLQKAYKELEVLDNAKIEFLHMLSHEIKTPLNGIKGFLDLLKLKIESDDLKGYLSHLDTSAKRLEEFSKRALIITSLRTKKHALNISSVNMVQLANSVLEYFKKDILDKGIKLDLLFSEDSVCFDADEHLITQIFKDILTNIFLHSPNTSEILFRISKKETQIEIEISDNGDGFSEKALENLFQPFGFGQKHINDKIGLGLHFVKLATEIQGISVEAGNKREGGAYVSLLKL